MKTPTSIIDAAALIIPQVTNEITLVANPMKEKIKENTKRTISNVAPIQSLQLII